MRSKLCIYAFNELAVLFLMLGQAHADTSTLVAGGELATELGTAETFGLSALEIAGAAAAAGVLVGLLLLKLIRDIWWRPDDIVCWNETCTLIEEPGPAEHIETGPIVTPEGVSPGSFIAQEACWYICESEVYGIKQDFLAEHIPGRPCPKIIESVYCMVNGMPVRVRITIDGVTKGKK